MNTFLKYLFSLGLFLLTGSQHLTSNWNTGISQAYVNGQCDTESVLVDSSNPSETYILHSLTGTDRHHFAIEEENVGEEEERTLMPKYYGYDFSLTFFFIALSLISFFNFSKRKLSYYFYFSYLPTSRRYLLFEIFRI